LADEAGITMKHTKQFGHVLALLTCAALGCTGAQSSTATTTAAVAHPHAAQALLVETASCWMGGIWGDVHGETPEERARSSDARCDAVVRDVWGKSDHTRFLQLRAFEPEAVDAVKRAIDRRALPNPAESRNVDGLTKIFTRLAFAERETMAARRAAHRVLRDWDHERDRLNDEEALALPELEHTIAFDELWRTDASELTAEAKVLALMVLLDRIRVSEIVPLHLKPYVVAEPLRTVFGATPPKLPHDASKPLENGAWLSFLVDVARQARHPVTDEAAAPRIRHDAAMAGILAGIADQLEQNESALGEDAPLAEVTRKTIRALRANP
jgi:hypothetical protein